MHLHYLHYLNCLQCLHYLNCLHSQRMRTTMIGRPAVPEERTAIAGGIAAAQDDGSRAIPLRYSWTWTWTSKWKDDAFASSARTTKHLGSVGCSCPGWSFDCHDCFVVVVLSGCCGFDCHCHCHCHCHSLGSGSGFDCGFDVSGPRILPVRWNFHGFCFCFCCLCCFCCRGFCFCGHRPAWRISLVPFLGDCEQ